MFLPCKVFSQGEHFAGAVIRSLLAAALDNDCMAGLLTHDRIFDQHDYSISK